MSTVPGLRLFNIIREQIAKDNSPDVIYEVFDNIVPHLIKHEIPPQVLE